MLTQCVYDGYEVLCVSLSFIELFDEMSLFFSL